MNFYHRWFKNYWQGHHDCPIWWRMNDIDLSGASLPLIGVELSWTALPAAPGPMSSHTRQCSPLLQVQCRVTLDSGFRRCRSSVESHSTSLSSVPGPMSSHTRHRSPPFQVQCRVILYSVFRRCRSNVESHSTSLSSVPGPMSSHTRHRCLPFQVQCRAHIDSFLLCSWLFL